jgi:hypothetical protein
MQSRPRRALTRGTALLVMVSLLSLQPAPAVATRPRPAPRDHLDIAYVRAVIEDLTSIGSTDLGFRVFGTPEDRATADYIAGPGLSCN